MADADTAVFVWLNGRTGALAALDGTMEVLGSDYSVPVVMGLVILGLWFAGHGADDRARRQVGVFVVLTAIGLASWIVFAGNELYFRPRPFDAALDHDVTVLLYRPTDSSFPSNSAAVAFAAAGGVWLISRKAGLALLALASAYGLARVYGGIHYPLDILGGAAVGLLAVVMARAFWGLLGPVPAIVIRAARIFCIA
jgi:undecaprenyl-diphosphatase